MNNEKAKSNKIENIAKSVIHVFLLGKDRFFYTTFSSDKESFYSLVNARPAHFLKFPTLPREIPFFQFPATAAEKVTRSQKKLICCKSSLTELDTAENLAEWAHLALHTGMWTTVQKNFFVLVANKDKHEFELKIKQLKNWKLSKNISKHLSSLKSLKPIALKNIEDLKSKLKDNEFIALWNDFVDLNKSAKYP
jgi:hypothetical protein